MRSASQPGYDGPRNLADAVRVAASPEAADADLGAVVVLDGSIEPADDVTKTHASAFDTFRSLDVGSLGRVADGRVAAGAGAGTAASRGRVASRGAGLPRHRDRRHGRDADPGPACGGRGRVRRGCDRGGQHGSLAPRRRGGRDGRRAAGRPRHALPGGRGRDRLRVPGRRRDVAAGRRARRRSPERSEGADRARARPGCGPGSRRAGGAPRRSGPDPRPGPLLEPAGRPEPDRRTQPRIGGPPDAARPARHRRPDRDPRGRPGLRLGRGRRDHGRPDRVRRLGGGPRDAGRSAHAPDRARSRRGGDPGADGRAPPPRRGRPVARPDRSHRAARRSRTGSRSSRPPTRAADPDAWLGGPRLAQRPLGRLADGRRSRAGRAGPGHGALGPRSPRALGEPAALAVAGVDRDTADPSGGIIRRDADGEPTGVLHETAARIVVDKAPPPTADAGRIVDPPPGSGPRPAGRGGGPRSGRAVAPGGPRARDRGLPRTGRARTSCRSASTPRSGRSSSPPRSRPGCIRGDPLGPVGGRARFGWLKLFADGTLASRTAALLEPIEPEEGRPLPAGTERGIWLTPPEEVAAFARRAAEAGIATQVHAIGDRACRLTLDALEAVAGRTAQMPRLEHVQLLHPDDRRAVRPGRHRRVDPADPRPGGRADRADALGRAGRDARLPDALAAGLRRRRRLRHRRAGRADRSVARAVDGGHPGRRVVAGAAASPSGRTSALTLEQAVRAACVAPAVVAAEPDRGRLVPGQRADLIVLPARALVEPGRAGRRPGDGPPATGDDRRRGRVRALTTGAERARRRPAAGGGEP